MTDAGFEQGAPDPDARLKGEIEDSVLTWAAEYEREGVDLAWTVARVLLQHVNRTSGLANYIRFEEKLAEILGDEAAELRKAIDADWRRQLN